MWVNRVGLFRELAQSGLASEGRFSECPRERVDRIRLLEEFETVMAFTGDDVTVATRQDDRQTRVTHPDHLRHLKAGHPRHDDVREYDIERQIICTQQRQGGACVSNPASRIAEVGQHLRCEGANGLVVFDQQDTQAIANRISERGPPVGAAASPGGATHGK
jgi:hypothetical protein